jgi:hypothetical protein
MITVEHTVPVKLPPLPHVQIPPPLYPSSHVTLTVLPVIPMIELTLAKFESTTSVGVHEFALHSAPVKFPPVPHVHVPPPLYPVLQVTLTVLPVLPVIEPVLAKLE